MQIQPNYSHWFIIPEKLAKQWMYHSDVISMLYYASCSDFWKDVRIKMLYDTLQDVEFGP